MKKTSCKMLVAGVLVASTLACFAAPYEDLDTSVLRIDGVEITSSAAEINIMDGVTSTASEINQLGALIAGTGTAMADTYMFIGNSSTQAVASTPAAVRTNLDLEIGTDVQAYDSDLDTWATISPSANAQALAILDYAAMRTNLSLVVGTDVLAPGGDLTGQINSIAVATVTDGAALGATALQPVTQVSGVSTASLVATVTFQSSISGPQSLTGWISESAGGVGVGTNAVSIADGGDTAVLAGGGAGDAYAVWTSHTDGLSTLDITFTAGQVGLYFNTVQRNGVVVSTPAITVAP